MHLTKQQAFDADLETKKQINFTGNLDQAEDTEIVFILEETKETLFGIFTRNCKSIMNVYHEP